MSYQVLTQNINVKVKVVVSEVYGKSIGGEKIPANAATFRVNIHDPLNRIQKLMGIDESVLNSYMLVNGCIIENPGNETFADQFIKNSSTIVLKCKSSEISEPMKWCRFNRV